MTSLVARQNSPSHRPYRHGATGRGGAPALIDSPASGRGETNEPITTVGGPDEQGPQPMGRGKRSLGCQDHAVAKAAVSAVAAAAAAVRAGCRHLPRAGAMVKLAAKCVLAGESGPPAPIRPASHSGVERAPWGGVRPAAQAARLPTASRRGAAPPQRRWGRGDRREVRTSAAGGGNSGSRVCYWHSVPAPAYTWSRAVPREREVWLDRLKSKDGI